MSQILVIGSLAYDSITTPLGHVQRTLGGSANYFSMSASHFSKVSVVGVVGSDYDPADLELLQQRGVDIKGIEISEGKTFHWAGKYENNLNEPHTLATELNVFADFSPVLRDEHKSCTYVFLGNIHPSIQLNLLEQVHSPKVIACDTMNFWISSELKTLKKVLEKVHILLINESEAKALTQKPNAILAAQEIVNFGPQAVVIKRGEYGFILYAENQFFILPAFPVGNVVDPTGAGDTFAGGFLGSLAQHIDGRATLSDMKRACVYGCLFASFTVQDFGLRKISQITWAEVEARHLDYQKILSFD